MFIREKLFATYLINRFPTCVLNGISPIKHMLSFFPNSLLMLSLSSCVFWCVSFVHSHNPHHGMLNPRAVKCGKSYLKVEPVIESLPYPTQDVIKSLPDVQVQEVMEPTLILEQVQLSESNVSLLVVSNYQDLGLWIKIILDDFKVKYERPIKLFYDNNSTISIVHNPVQHDMTKHIEIDK
ncbi:hypothetical protein CR513_61998, partial [Mucuna pruriens]